MQSDPDAILLPVSRTRALTRALVWGVPTVLLSATTALIYRDLHFVPSSVSNRLVEYSVAIIALPMPLAALWTACKALRWLLFAGWPGSLGIVASSSQLRFSLGSFGRMTFDADRLELRYPFELADDEDDASFESFLPEEQQRATLLPRISHPDLRAPLNRTILRFALADEFDAVRILRPMIDRWRAAQSRTPSL